MKTTRSLKTLGVIAIIFGALTVFSGGRALFGGEDARQAVGNAVSFVLWFNFLAGFAYALTGFGILKARGWAARAALGLALATAGIAVAFGVHALNGGAYETRTAAALALRLGFWVVVAAMTRPLWARPTACTKT